MSHLWHADSTHRAGTEKHLFLPEMPEKMKFFMNSEEFARRLCSWQREKGRQNLPWFTSDPYRRWLSEIMLQQTRHWLYYCLWKLDQGQSINADIAMLKSWGTRAHLQIADNAIEVYGGLGYTEEVRVGRIWRDLRGNMLAGGTCEVMDYIAGRAIPKLYK